MPTRPPPPRYRVVERGRRLEVIDTATGTAVQPAPAALPKEPGRSLSRWPTLPEPVGFDGRALLLTHRLYDDKAPRRLQLDPGTMQWLTMARNAALAVALTIALVAFVAPVVLLVPLAIAAGLVRTAPTLRRRVTDRLDRFDAAAAS